MRPFSVLMGSRVYENITKRSDENFSGTTALSYIANKIRQGDREDAVDIIEVDGTPVLQLKQKVGDEMYHTWIYWKDGQIRELFTDENSGLGLEDGLEILECDGLPWKRWKLCETADSGIRWRKTETFIKKRRKWGR